MKRIVCIIASTGTSFPNSQRVAHLVRELSEMEGVTVTTEDKLPEQQTPRSKLAVTGMTLMSVELLKFINSRTFDLPDIKIATLRPESTANYRFPKLSHQHAVRARQEIKRFSLNPRVMKKQRKLRYRF